MTNTVDFTDEELIDQLRQLNYNDVSEDSLRKFKKELEDLTILHSSYSKLSPETKFTPLSTTDTTPKTSPSSFDSSVSTYLPHTENASLKTLLESSLTGNDTSKFDEKMDSVVNGSTQRSPLQFSHQSSRLSTGRSRKPLIRKNIRRVNGKPIVFVESRSELQEPSDLWNSKDETAGDSNQSLHSFVALTPYTTSTTSSYESSQLSSMNHSTPKMEYEVDANSSKSTDNTSIISSSSSLRRIRKLPTRKMSRNSIVSIEKIPRSMLSSSILTGSINSSLTSQVSVMDDNFIGNNVKFMPNLKRSHSCDDISIIKYPTKSFIRPSSCIPRGQRSRKNDPVKKYHEYKQYWDVFKAPGERSHKQLRWMVREHMLSDPSEKRNMNSAPFHSSTERIKGLSIPWKN